MPNAKPSAPAKARPAILLLEEYDALAVAISSALKKFAPGHLTYAATSLREAEALAGQIAPELFIIDVDPPWSKITPTLVKWRDEHPNARGLVIGATIPAEIRHERGQGGALQFLRKPFDVDELGAAVQALLGAWSEAEPKASRGTFELLNAADAALLQCASGRNVALEIKKGANKSGEIVFHDGQPVHAEAGKHTGVDALQEMFSWSEPQMREKEKRGRPATKTIAPDWAEDFVEALRGARPVIRTRKASVPPPTPVAEEKPAAVAPPAPVVRSGKKLVLVDDTEMLLIFVEDALITADPQLQITTAPTGAQGVSTIAQVRPDLVLLDYSLPDFNGDEVCRRLLENEATANIPILMMSGHVAEMARSAAIFENIVATIEKPFLSDALVALVQKTLAGKRRPRPKLSPPEDAPAPVRAKTEAKPPVASAPAVARAPEVIAPTPEPPAPPVPWVQTFTPPPPEEPARPAPLPPEPAQVPTAPIQTYVPAPPEPEPPRPSIPTYPAPPTPFVHIPEPIGPPGYIAPVEPAPPPVPRIPRAPQRESVGPFGISPDVSIVSERQGIAPSGTASVISSPVLGAAQEVVLGLFLEVTSLQLTPSLRMGAIRAKPSASVASLLVASPELRAALPPKGFQLGAAELDRTGRLSGLRVVPTVQPFTPLETRNALQIGGLSVVPENSHELLQLTSNGGAPMRMHLVAKLTLAGVELSPAFQITQLVLRTQANRVRVTLNNQSFGGEGEGTLCEVTHVALDAAGHMHELLLNPAS